MPSSTSSSDRPAFGPRLPTVKPQPGELPSHETPPVDPPIRTLPQRPLGKAWLLALLAFVVALLGWELYWRSQGIEPGYRNSEGLWAIQQRRIDHGEGDALAGAAGMVAPVGNRSRPLYRSPGNGAAA